MTAAESGASVPKPVIAIKSAWEFREWMGLFALNFILIGLAVFRVPYLSGVPERALDIPFKAAWVVYNWNDAAKLPPHSFLCSEPFCVRTDVEKKRVGGRPDHVSETKWRYCPLHRPDFLTTQSRFDLVLLSGYLILAAIGGLIVTFTFILCVVRTALLPVLLVLVLAKKLPALALVPFVTGISRRLEDIDTAAVMISCLLFAAMLVMYAIW